jgi:hypothetical protein
MTNPAREFIENDLLKFVERESNHIIIRDYILVSRYLWDKPDTGEVDEAVVKKSFTIEPIPKETFKIREVIPRHQEPKPLPALPEKIDTTVYYVKPVSPEAFNQLTDCVAALYEERNRGRV